MSKKPNAESAAPGIKTLGDLIDDDLNANKGTERGRTMIENSLETYGAGRSVLVDKNGKLIAGNKTAKAAKSRGMNDVIVVKTDGKQIVVVQRTDLDLDTDPKARELAVMDNRSNEVSLSWDAENLKAMQEQGADLSLAFFPNELEMLTASETAESLSVPNSEPPSEFPVFDESIETKHKCPKCQYEWSGKSS